MKDTKLVVYTCITNQKDVLQPVQKVEGVKYICFSDREFKHPIWQYRPIEALGQTDPRRIARRYKILSHIYFPNQTTLWIDGRGQLNISPLAFLNRYNKPLVLRNHHSRNCIYAEAEEVKRLKFDDIDIVDSQMDRYKKEGMPKNAGLHETGAILRRPTSATDLFNTLWWAEVSSGSKRDQLSFDYVAWCLHIIDIGTMDRSDVKFLNHQRKTNAKY